MYQSFQCNHLSDAIDIASFKSSYSFNYTKSFRRLLSIISMLLLYALGALPVLTNAWAEETTIVISTDNAEEVYFNGALLGKSSDWKKASSYKVTLQPGKNVLAVKGMDTGGIAALIAEIRRDGNVIVSDSSWKVSTTEHTGWKNVGFNDSGWASATTHGRYGVSPWSKKVTGFPSNSAAQWIWSANNYKDDTVYFRYTLTSNTGPFRQAEDKQKLISIEAENYHRHTPQGKHTWMPVSNTSHSNTKAMRASPVDQTNLKTGYATTSPRLDYQVEFVTTGTHYIWIRGLGNIDADSLHVGLNGTEVSSGSYITRFTPLGQSAWSNRNGNGAVRKLNITSPGVHTINVWMRESGMVFDKLVLTTDPNYAPTGMGPAESSRGSNSGNGSIPDVITTDVDKPAKINVLGTSRGTVTIIDAPTKGTASVQADNTILYTPSKGYVGQDTFTYKITGPDGSITIATLTVKVGCTQCSADVNLTLTWKPSAGSVLGYRVYYGPTSGTVTQQLSDLYIATGEVNARAPAVTYNATKHLGMRSGDSVCFRVKAYNAVGESGFSTTACTNI